MLYIEYCRWGPRMWALIVNSVVVETFPEENLTEFQSFVIDFRSGFCLGSVPAIGQC